MKKQLCATLVAAALCLTACGEEKNQAYYLKNIDKAEAKKSECENKLKEAFKNKDENALKALDQDTECTAAIAAIKEDRKNKAEQARQAKEAQAQAAIESEKAKLKQELGQADWKAAAHHFVNSECATFGNSFSKTGFVVPEDNYYCRAAVEIQQDFAEQGKAELLKFNYADLLAQEKTYCSQDKRMHSACSIWENALGIQAEKAFDAQTLTELEAQKEDYSMYQNNRPLSAKRAFEKAFKTKEQAVIDHYTQNYEALKKDYNQCIEKLAQIGNAWENFEARSKVKETYPCAQAQAARGKLGLTFDDFKMRME